MCESIARNILCQPHANTLATYRWKTLVFAHAVEFVLLHLQACIAVPSSAMASHKRVKDIDYDEDDLYSGDEDDYDNAGGDGLTEEDKENFAALTPVVRAELAEAGLQVDTKEIEDALWHYFWDVGKSVTYLKNAKQPKKTATKTPPVKEKAKSKFDQAQEESAKTAGGESAVPFHSF